MEPTILGRIWDKKGSGIKMKIFKDIFENEPVWNWGKQFFFIGDDKPHIKPDGT